MGKIGSTKKNFSSKTLLFPKMSDVFLKNDKQFYVCYITIRQEKTKLRLFRAEILILLFIKKVFFLETTKIMTNVDVLSRYNLFNMIGRWTTRVFSLIGRRMVYFGKLKSLYLRYPSIKPTFCYKINIHIQTFANIMCSSSNNKNVPLNSEQLKASRSVLA